LDLQPVDVDVWSVPNPPVPRPNVFGGQVAAQALLAASRTVDPDRPVHSLHAYFLRGGRPGEPMTVAVERTRDGRSFATRRVLASQEGEVVFGAAVSFQREEPTATLMRPFPKVPDPDACGDLPTDQASEGAVALRAVPPTAEDSPLGELRVWVRTRDALPDDPALHAAALVFMSDLRTGVAIAVGLGDMGQFGTGPFGMGKFGMVASLDHAFWLHVPARADRWLLMSVETIAYARSRGLVLGTFHTEQGDAVASYVQELVMRPSNTGAGQDHSRG